MCIYIYIYVLRHLSRLLALVAHWRGHAAVAAGEAHAVALTRSGQVYTKQYAGHDPSRVCVILYLLIRYYIMLQTARIMPCNRTYVAYI